MKASQSTQSLIGVSTPNVQNGVTTPKLKNRTFRFVAETYRL